MIKNPKVGQTVYYLDNDNNILRGKISQVYCASVNGSIGVDNFHYMEKSFAFSTKKSANEYQRVTNEIAYLNVQIQSLSKQREKYATKLAKMLENKGSKTTTTKFPKTWGTVNGRKF